MKNIIYTLIIVVIGTSLSGCFEEEVVTVTTEPTEEISEKLKELRELQRQVDDENVESTDIQAKINDLVTQINNLVPVGTIPITYSLGITNASLTGGSVGISDAVVTLFVRGEQVSDTTNSDGQVVFNDLRSGVVTVHVAVDGYTDASFVVDLLVDGTPSDYQATGEDFNVSSLVSLYPTTAANGASVWSGSVYYDPDRTDDLAPGDPGYGQVNYFNADNFGDEFLYYPPITTNLTDGVFTSTSSNDIDVARQSWAPADVALNMFAAVLPRAADYNFVPAGNPGNILLAIYEEMFATATSDPTDGSYQIVLPLVNVSSGTNTVRFHLSEVAGTQQFIRTTNFDTGTGTTSTTLGERDVIYTPMFMVRGTGILRGPGNPLLNEDVNNFDNLIFDSDDYEIDFYYRARRINE